MKKLVDQESLRITLCPGPETYREFDTHKASAAKVIAEETVRLS